MSIMYNGMAIVVNYSLQMIRWVLRRHNSKCNFVYYLECLLIGILIVKIVMEI